jgi:hypothetical protein
MAQVRHPPDLRVACAPPAPIRRRCGPRTAAAAHREKSSMGSVIKKRRKRMAKKKHRKLLRKTRVARRKAGK